MNHSIAKTMYKYKKKTLNSVHFTLIIKDNDYVIVTSIISKSKFFIKFFSSYSLVLLQFDLASVSAS